MARTSRLNAWDPPRNQDGSSTWKESVYGNDINLGGAICFAAMVCQYLGTRKVIKNAHSNRSLAYPFIITLPFSNTLLPIALPTVYLWIVDTLALKRGTWVIEPGTKFGWHLWDGLDIEYATPVSG